MGLTDLIRPILAEIPGIRLGVVFGSVARSQDRPGSDVDLGVWLAEDDPSQLWNIEVAVAGGLKRTIDLIDLRRAPPLLRFEIAREGIPVLERDEGGWSQFKVRAMLDWWDFAPLARKFHQQAADRLREEIRSGQT